jgi:hypothetical protein
MVSAEASEEIGVGSVMADGNKRANELYLTLMLRIQHGLPNLSGMAFRIP